LPGAAQKFSGVLAEIILGGLIFGKKWRKWEMEEEKV
jgi:hypothetical protein